MDETKIPINKYKPSPEEIKKAEEMMTREEKERSEEREDTRLEEEHEAEYHKMNKAEYEQSKKRNLLLKMREMGEEKFNNFIWEKGVKPFKDMIASYKYRERLIEEREELKSRINHLKSKLVEEITRDDINMHFHFIEEEIEKIEKIEKTLDGIETLLFDNEWVKKESQLREDEKMIAIKLTERYEGYRNFTRIKIVVDVENEKGEKRALLIDGADTHLRGLEWEAREALELLRTKEKLKKEFKDFKEKEEELLILGINTKDKELFL